MASFCYDQYEHPLLWCNEKKRFVERQNADESLRQWRQKKAEESTRKEQDKREYIDLNTKHCPWGKPGGGAPNLDVRRRDITASGLHSTPGTKIIPGLRGTFPSSYRVSFDAGTPFHGPGRFAGGGGGGCGGGGGGGGGGIGGGGRTSSIYRSTPCLPPPTPGPICGSAGKKFGEIDNDFGKSSNGDPVRTAADRLYITLKENQPMNIRNKGHVDIELRYKTLPKGKKMLEKIVVTEQPKCPYSSSIKPKKSTGKNDPWGKPGPGGKPWRSQQKVGGTFMKSLGWTNKDLMKELDDQNPIHKKPPTKQLVRKKGSKDDSVLKSCCKICTCKCPAIKTSCPGSPLKKSSIQKQFSVSRSPLKGGSGGGGGGGSAGNDICLKDDEQKICPRFYRTCTAIPKTANQGVELVPLLARRRGMNRPISLSSTDITKRMPDNRWTQQEVDYLNVLANQMSQKRRSKNIQQLNEKELSQTHFETLDTFWGRPGNGAPRDIKHKLNLDDLLYGVAV